jgi:hypothetical protein
MGFEKFPHQGELTPEDRKRMEDIPGEAERILEGVKAQKDFRDLDSQIISSRKEISSLLAEIENTQKTLEMMGPQVSPHVQEEFLSKIAYKKQNVEEKKALLQFKKNTQEKLIEDLYSCKMNKVITTAQEILQKEEGEN